MKNIKLVELLSEIKANLVAFVSIAMFVCLGIGLFLGIQWGGEAISRMAEKTFEEGQLHDVELSFPYGLTEDDIAALKAVEGVTDVEPGYASYVSMLDGSASYVIKVQSLTQRIDTPKLVAGELPRKANEVAMLSFWAEEHGYGVGDTVTFVSDSDGEDDADGMAQLNAGSFTITGLVEHTAYLSKVVGSLGSASIGAGTVDCVVFAPNAAFDPESYDNCYSNAYLRCDSLREHSTFDDAYKTGLAAIIEDIEELGSVRGDARYNSVHDEADQKIADAEQEIADANKKLADAEQDISDGEKEIKDGEEALADGKKEIDDGRDQIADGEKQLTDARKELADGESQYGEAKSTAESKQAEAKKQLDASRAQLDSAQGEYDRGKQEYDDAKSEYDKFNDAYTKNKDDYEKSLVEIVALRKEEQALEEKKQAYDDALVDYLNARDDLEIAQSNVGYAQSELPLAQAASEEAAAELEAARSVVDDAQKAVDGAQGPYNEAKAAYDEKAAAYGAAKEAYDSLSGDAGDDEAIAAAKETMDAAKGAMDAAEEAMNAAKADLDAAEGSLSAAKEQLAAAQSKKDQTDEELQAAQEFVTSTAVELKSAQKAKIDAWQALEAAYDDLKPAYNSTKGTYNSLVDHMAKLSDAFGLGFKVTSDNKIHDLSPLTEENLGAPGLDADDATTKATTLLALVDNATYTKNGKTYTYDELPQALSDAKKELDKAKAKLDSGKQQLDQGWSAYYAAQGEYDRQVANGNAQLAEAREKLDDGWSEYRQGLDELEQARVELADAVRTYEEKKQELEDGKKELEEAKQKVVEKRGELQDAIDKLKDAQKKLDEMEEYEWIVLARPENGGVNSLDTIKAMMGNVRWAMALLFVLVGLFVCYSAVARLVNDEVVQIGTKKAVGFREREVATEYLSFSGIAVLAGTLLAAVVAVAIVQGIMNPACAESFTLPSFPPYFNLFDLLAGGGIELVLILLSTWLATHGLLKKNAIDLLNGGETKAAKQHFYERWPVWNKLGLYTQTIINNCINDTRRMAATLIGVIGCTALIVTAVTLWSNVSRGFDRHYDEIYHFDTIVYLDEDVDGAAAKVGKAMEELGMPSQQAHLEVMQVRQSDGYRNTVNVFVPTAEGFDDYFTLLAVDGECDSTKPDGILISQAYADHMGVGVGDEVKITENNGRAHFLKVAGVFEYYLLHNEFVLSAEQYRTEFGGDPTTNVLLAGAGDNDLDTVRSALRKVEGYETLADNYSNSYYAFREMSSLLETVVAVYLLLSALMALVVLLNLDIMFVDEKKRELIVLMICGFSTKDAKAYIYRDSLVLTVIGVIAGVVFGAMMGNVTVSALEPVYGSFLKGFNWLAAIVGVVGAGTFSVAVLLFALRKIPRFDLTDINRF